MVYSRGLFIFFCYAPGGWLTYLYIFNTIDFILFMFIRILDSNFIFIFFIIARIICWVCLLILKIKHIVFCLEWDSYFVVNDVMVCLLTQLVCRFAHYIVSILSLAYQTWTMTDFNRGCNTVKFRCFSFSSWVLIRSGL